MQVNKYIFYINAGEKPPDLGCIEKKSILKLSSVKLTVTGINKCQFTNKAPHHFEKCQ